MPVELLDMIVDALCLEEKTAASASVASCALVSHSFSKRTRRHVFRFLCFTNLQRLQSFHALCSSAHDLPVYVRELLLTSETLETSWDPNENDLLITVIQPMRNLHAFGLQKFQCETFPDEIYSTLSTFPLKSLRLAGLKIPRPQKLLSLIRRCSTLQQLILGPGLLLDNLVRVEPEPETQDQEAVGTAPPSITILAVVCNHTTTNLLSMTLKSSNPPFHLKALRKLDISLYDSKDIADISSESLISFDVKLLQSLDIRTQAPPSFRLDIRHPRVVGFDICDVPGYFEPLAFLLWWADVLDHTASPEALEVLMIRLCVDLSQTHLLTICSPESNAAWRSLDSILSDTRFSGLRHVLVYMTAVKSEDFSTTDPTMLSIETNLTECLAKLKGSRKLIMEVLD
ncbi:hypothetical protein BDZ89DRAFT_1117335 [Hymenopellis radicata]|nr:hypothetical protein BDZ89DRAFT_1117335 [Hymenopellis radicata]